MTVGVSSGLANSVTMINLSSSSCASYVPCKLGIDLKPVFGIRRGLVRINTRSEFRNDDVESSALKTASVSALEAIKISAGDSGGGSECVVVSKNRLPFRRRRQKRRPSKAARVRG